VTTNLDAQRTAVWDMGKIAVSGDGAIFCSCSFARGGRGHSGGQLPPDEWLSAAMAISGVVLSGGASVEAILRGNWNL
jgi:hypothetical protein